jgi:hypothetical protein
VQAAERVVKRQLQDRGIKLSQVSRSTMRLFVRQYLQANPHLLPELAPLLHNSPIKHRQGARIDVRNFLAGPFRR